MANLCWRLRSIFGAATISPRPMLTTDVAIFSKRVLTLPAAVTVLRTTFGKEQADYNLQYLISVTLLDGQAGPAQLVPERIQATDAQGMVARVEVRPDADLRRAILVSLPRVTVWTKNGRILAREHLGYEGGLDQPMSWERTVEKFHWLSEQFADADLRRRIIEAVENLDARPFGFAGDVWMELRLFR